MPSRYFVFDVPTPEGDTIKVWLDGKFRNLRLLDAATFHRLQAIWKARSVLLPVVLIPAAALVLLLFAQGQLAQETFFYIIIGALVVDMAARLMLGLHERRCLAHRSLHPIPAESAEMMSKALKAGDIAGLRAATAAIVATMVLKR